MTTRIEPLSSRVLFTKYAGTEIRLDDAEDLIIDAGELLAVERNGTGPG